MDFFWEVISEIAQIFRTSRFVLIYLLEEFPWLLTAESSSNKRRALEPWLPWFLSE